MKVYLVQGDINNRKVASPNTSRLDAYVDFFFLYS